MNETVTPIKIIDKSDIYCQVSDGIYFGVIPPVTIPMLDAITPDDARRYQSMMAQPHKLDRRQHIGDGSDSLNYNDDSWVENAELAINLYAEGFDASQTEILGLGAGVAYPELRLAEKLGVPFGKVTLLDRHFSARARERITRVAPDATVIEQGMFSFLSNPDGRKYSLVTTLGLHDAIDEFNKDEFLGLVINVMTEGGILLLTSTALPGQATVNMARRYGLVAPGNLYQDFLFRYLPQEASL